MRLGELTDKQAAGCISDGRNWAAVVRKQASQVETALHDAGCRFVDGEYRQAWQWAAGCEVTARKRYSGAAICAVVIEANYGQGECFTCEAITLAGIRNWRALLEAVMEAAQLRPVL